MSTHPISNFPVHTGRHAVGYHVDGCRALLGGQCYILCLSVNNEELAPRGCCYHIICEVSIEWKIMDLYVSLFSRFILRKYRPISREHVKVLLLTMLMHLQINYLSLVITCVFFQLFPYISRTFSLFYWFYSYTSASQQKYNRAERKHGVGTSFADGTGAFLTYN